MTTDSAEAQAAASRGAGAQTPPQTPPKASQQQQQPQEGAERAGKCNLTLVLKERLLMELEQRPLPPKPTGTEVTLATHTVGICGSDVKYWQAGKIGAFVVEKPLILGHETSAIVVDVGPEVRRLKVGDRVACEVGVPCADCSYCLRGKYNQCPEIKFAATPPVDGTLTRYWNHKESFCFKLPDSMSLEEGALIEPLAVAIQACKRAPVRLADVVLICGAGPIGLFCMMTAKAFGAGQVILTDINESRLEFARQLGADKTFLIGREAKPAEMAAMVRAYVAQVKGGQEGTDVVLDCSGAESSIHLAIYAAAMGSVIVCVGCQQDFINLPLNAALMHEVDIKGIFRYRNCYPLALSLVKSGKINLKPMISHRFKLEQAKDAFEACLRGEGVKIVINCVDPSQKELAGVK